LCLTGGFVCLFSNVFSAHIDNNYLNNNVFYFDFDGRISLF
jgi:hypothetical protein